MAFDLKDETTNELFDVVRKFLENIHQAMKKF